MHPAKVGGKQRRRGSRGRPTHVLPRRGGGSLPRRAYVVHADKPSVTGCASLFLPWRRGPPGRHLRPPAQDYCAAPRMRARRAVSSRRAARARRSWLPPSRAVVRVHATCTALCACPHQHQRHRYRCGWRCSGSIRMPSKGKGKRIKEEPVCGQARM